MLWQLKNIYLKGKKDFRLENISIDIDNGAFWCRKKHVIKSAS